MKYVVIILSMVSFFWFSGCGKKNGAATSTGTAILPTPGGCAVGQVSTTQYGCLNVGPCASGYGYAPTAPTADKCVAGTLVTYDNLYGTAANLRWGSSLTIASRSAFEGLMKEYGGFCDPTLPPLTFVWPTVHCSDYSSSGFLILQTSSTSTNQAMLIVGAGSPTPLDNGISLYYGRGNYQTMQIPVDVYTVGTGLELWSNGLTHTSSWNWDGNAAIKAYVQTGTLNDTRLNVDLYYKGTRIGSSRMNRY